MRILCFFIFLFFCIEPAFAQSNGQQDYTLLNTNISVQFPNSSIEEILQILHKSYGINFSYAPSILPETKSTNIKAANLPLYAFLDQLFKGKDLEYVVIGTQIVLIKKNKLPEKAKDTLKSDTLEFSPVHSDSHTPFYISLKDFIYLKYFQGIYLAKMANLAKDSLQKQSAYIDSLNLVKKQLRKARINYFNSHSTESKYAVSLAIRPEMTFWRMRGSLDQSIDYSKYNNYDSPDLSFSIQAGFKYRLYSNFHLQYLTGFSHVTRKGYHTDYFISFFAPNSIQSVTSNFSSNYLFYDNSIELGNKIISGRWSVAYGVSIGTSINLGKLTPDYFPFYEPKYYIYGPPFFDEKYRKLEPEEIHYRTWLPFWNFNSEMTYKITNKLDVFGNLNFRASMLSLYVKGNSVNEKYKLVGLGFGVRINF